MHARTTPIAPILLALVTALPLGSCFHVAQPPPITIARQATPNPFSGVRTYWLAPFSFSGFTFEGQSEAAWQATRSPAQQASWANDKQNAIHYIERWLPRWVRNGEHVETLTSSAAPGQFVLAINVDAWINGGCHATLHIQDATGQTLDEVGIPVDRVRGGYGFADAFHVCLNSATMRSLEYIRGRY